MCIRGGLYPIPMQSCSSIQYNVHVNFNLDVTCIQSTMYLLGEHIQHDQSCILVHVHVCTFRLHLTCSHLHVHMRTVTIL